MLETNTLIAAVVLGAVFFFSILLLSRRSSKAKSYPTSGVSFHGLLKTRSALSAAPTVCLS